MPGADYTRARTPDFNPNAGMEPTNDTVLSAPLVNRALPIMPNVGLPSRDERTGAYTPSPAAIVPPEATPGADFATPEPLRATPPLQRSQVPIPGLPGTSDAPQSYNPMRAAEYDYVNSHPNSATVHGIGDRLKSGLKPALLGFLQAASRNPHNPMAAGAGGAMAGFGIGAINPTMGRAYEFDTTERPQLEADAAQEKAARAEALDTQYKTAQIGELQGRDTDRKADNELRRQKMKADAEMEQKRLEQDQWFALPATSGGVVNRKTGKIVANPNATPRAQAPAWRLTDQGWVDLNAPDNHGQSFGAPAKNKPMSARDAYDEVLAEDGSIDQIAQDSLAGRLDSLKTNLSPRERDIIEGRATDAFDSEIVKAKQRWQEIQNQELGKIRRDTESRAKAKAAGKRQGAGGSASTAPRNLKQLTEQFLK